MTFLCILFWMYFEAFLRVLRTRRVNTRLSGRQITAVQTKTPFLHTVISVFKESSDYGRKSAMGLRKWFELGKSSN